MDDVAFYVPRLTAEARQPVSDEPLWTLRKGAATRRAELRCHGKWGVEFRLFVDGLFIYGHRYPSRDLAVARAADECAQRRSEGWQ